MTEQETLSKAISDRLIDQINRGATSDTVLKLAEAWAWVQAPDQAHGVHNAS